VKTITKYWSYGEIRQLTNPSHMQNVCSFGITTHKYSGRVLAYDHGKCATEWEFSVISLLLYRAMVKEG